VRVLFEPQPATKHPSASSPTIATFFMNGPSKQ
jgi:hypothetical protein